MSRSRMNSQMPTLARKRGMRENKTNPKLTELTLCLGVERISDADISKKKENERESTERMNSRVSKKQQWLKNRLRCTCWNIDTWCGKENEILIEFIEQKNDICTVFETKSKVKDKTTQITVLYTTGKITATEEGWTTIEKYI